MACRCYKITNGGAEPCTTVYYDCNNTIQPLETPGESSTTLCANSFGDSACDSISMIGNCYNGVCLTGSTEQLLYDILTTLGPCPDICDGTAQLGGPAGTSLIDIRTGLRLNSNGESILPTPPPPSEPF
jgi:hypothetical protein